MKRCTWKSFELEPPDVSKLWIEHQRRTARLLPLWACIICPDRMIFSSDEYLWDHALSCHDDKMPTEASELAMYRIRYTADSRGKRLVLPFSLLVRCGLDRMLIYSIGLPLKRRDPQMMNLFCRLKQIANGLLFPQIQQRMRRNMDAMGTYYQRICFGIASKTALHRQKL